MPLSITATPMPLPLTSPSDSIAPAHAASAPVTSVVSAMCERTVRVARQRLDFQVLRQRVERLRATRVNTAPDASCFLMRRP